MNTRALLMGFALAVSVVAASTAFSQSAPPPSEKAKQTEALLNRAAALIDKNGKAAFAEFKKKGSEWLHDDTYLFSYDMNANVLLNPAFPAREGTNVHGQKDAKGKLFHDEIIRTAQTRGSGWVDYMFPKPGQTELSQKWTYVKKVTIDGMPGLIGSGNSAMAVSSIQEFRLARLWPCLKKRAEKGDEPPVSRRLRNSKLFVLMQRARGMTAPGLLPGA